MQAEVLPTSVIASPASANSDTDVLQASINMRLIVRVVEKIKTKIIWQKAESVHSTRLYSPCRWQHRTDDLSLIHI